MMPSGGIDSEGHRGWSVHDDAADGYERYLHQRWSGATLLRGTPDLGRTHGHHPDSDDRAVFSLDSDPGHRAVARPHEAAAAASHACGSTGEGTLFR